MPGRTSDEAAEGAMNPEPSPDSEPAAVDRGLWTVPNLISLLRICAIPLFLWLLLGADDPRGAAVTLIVIGASDFLDGALARKLGQTSEIGKLLDPTADRLAILAALAGGLAAGVVPGWLGWPLLVREILVGGGALFLVGKLSVKPAVRPAGKWATAIVYASIPAYYLAAAGASEWFGVPGFWEKLGMATGIVGLVLYWGVTWLYLGDLRRAMAASSSTST